MNTIIGNLLEITSGIVLHQVNCRGVVGGLAGALHRKHPVAFTDYFLLCEKYGAEMRGHVCEGHVSPRLSVVHVFGQINPGANTDLGLVRAALKELCDRPHLSPVYAPHQMGCGLGGGDWKEYSALLEEFFPDTVIVKLPAS